MKKLIFLLTIVCGIFLLNGCGTNGANSNGTDAIIGEWISIGDGKGFAKIKITKEANGYILNGKTYQAVLQKESASPQSPLIIKIVERNSTFLDTDNTKLTTTDDKYTLYINGRKSQPLKYDPKTNTISVPIGAKGSFDFKPAKTITEQEKRTWADQVIKELSNTYKAERDGQYGIIDKIDLSLIK